MLSHLSTMLSHLSTMLSHLSTMLSHLSTMLSHLSTMLSHTKFTNLREFTHYYDYSGSTIVLLISTDDYHLIKVCSSIIVCKFNKVRYCIPQPNHIA